jgi:hypothetical protein
MLKADLNTPRRTRSPYPPFLIETKRDDEAATIQLSSVIEDHIRRDEAYDEDTPYRRYPFKGT